MMKEQEISQVQDKPAEIWIKLLVIVTSIAVGMVGYGGDKVIEELKEIRKEVNAGNIKFENHEGRISSNTRASTDNTKRIIILERKQ
jgi:hypothetical protein